MEWSIRDFLKENNLTAKEFENKISEQGMKPSDYRRWLKENIIVLVKMIGKEVNDKTAVIAEKIRVLKDGEISTKFTEDQFILLQMQAKGPVYRRYEDVRGEISRKLALKAEGPADLNEWLAGLRKEAVEIR
ncbi:MAG: hypothetical protein ACM3MB_06585 [Acidobacteriota bacterium]